MNIIYLLTNINKKSGEKRFYIGSKKECRIMRIDNIDTIVCAKSLMPYYGCSQSQEMKDDLINLDTFEVKVLEEVLNRDDVFEREDYWIDHHKAVFSDEFYNISSSRLKYRDQEAIINSFGQSYKTVACDRSALGKRDNMAKSYGFDNFGSFYFYLWDRMRDGICANQLSLELKPYRHFVRRTLEAFDETKAREDLAKTYLKDEVRLLYLKGCTLQKISQILDLSLPVARLFLGDFMKKHERSKKVALLQGLSNDELEDKIVKCVIDKDMTFRDAAKECGINETSCVRYFLRSVKKRLRGSESQ